MPLTVNPSTSNSPPSEAALVNKLKSQDINAIAEFHQRYAAALYGVIQRIVKDAEESEDVLQQALLKIMQSIQIFDSTRSRLFTWAVNISRNLAIDKIRMRNRDVHGNHISFADKASQIDNRDTDANKFPLFIIHCESLNEQLSNLANMAERVESPDFKEGFRASVVARAKAANSFVTYRDKEGKLLEEWPATGIVERLDA